jgi:hypothetical protein
MDREPSRDWHGLTMTEAAARLERAGLVRLVHDPGEAGFVLGSVFWRAFLRGSAQAGAWVIDSIAWDHEVLGR